MFTASGYNHICHGQKGIGMPGPRCPFKCPWSMCCGSNGSNRNSARDDKRLCFPKLSQPRQPRCNFFALCKPAVDLWKFLVLLNTLLLGCWQQAEERCIRAGLLVGGCHFRLQQCFLHWQPMDKTVYCWISHNCLQYQCWQTEISVECRVVYSVECSVVDHKDEEWQSVRVRVYSWCIVIFEHQENK